LPDCGESDRPGIVHRLDKNTSGLLIIARTEETHGLLQQAIQERRVKRQYLALICGHLAEESGRIDLPIGRSLRHRTRMAVTNQNSRESVTDYTLKDRYRSYDLVEIVLQTGRTHQIRVHFSHLGHPVFGDPEYGGREKWHRGIFGPERPLAQKLLGVLQRQALHAGRLVFVHPITGEALDFAAEPPADFQELLVVLDAEGR
ncbi:MAG: RNA pseudouridine synthase, partial [candidate division Zixibacteria bacterium]|nr:RNA pseudouridine synthase [candidate division Zixibacteria bacterium]